MRKRGGRVGRRGVAGDRHLVSGKAGDFPGNVKFERENMYCWGEFVLEERKRRLV